MRRSHSISLAFIGVVLLDYGADVTHPRYAARASFAHRGFPHSSKELALLSGWSMDAA
jgi:hypothetical protein